MVLFMGPPESGCHLRAAGLAAGHTHLAPAECHAPSFAGGRLTEAGEELGVSIPAASGIGRQSSCGYAMCAGAHGVITGRAAASSAGGLPGRVRPVRPPASSAVDYRPAWVRPTARRRWFTSRVVNRPARARRG
jgi:hypothetical protein